jgi:hypothetical protein
MAALFPGTWNPLDSSRDKQELLRQLSSLAPQAALREISGLIASVANARSLPFDQRLGLVRQLEEAAGRHVIACSREYLTSPRRGDQGQDEQFHLWRTNRDYWSQLATAYNICVNAYREESKPDALHKVELTRLLVRLLRAYGARLKWDQFHYGPHSEALWQVTGRAYLLAVEEGVDRRLATAAYAGKAHDTTVEQEYLKILMFQASSMDSLMPLEVEIADRLIAHYLPLFSLSAERSPELVYWIDPSQRRGPTRLVREPFESETLRYFGAGRALAALDELQQVMEKGAVPAELELGRAYSPRIILPVVRHLAAYWAANPPRREFDRYKVNSRLTVVSGLPMIHRKLREARADGPNGAEWTVDNVSRFGMGVQLPLADHEGMSPIQIGTLLGMQPEDAENMLVGIVRRFSRDSDAQASIGIETLTKKAVPFEIDSSGRKGEALLLDSLELGQPVRMAVPSAGSATAATVTVFVDGKTARLAPVELIERGVAFDLTRYRVEAVA